ncbi:MAG TPA: serine hydrolase domain-containing protein [Pseudolysinimonas sp.]|jgi:CubicO group peptidase (beta-lactamase class C family)
MSAAGVDRLLRDAYDGARFSAAVCLAAVNGEVIIDTSVGELAAWSDDFKPIPPDERSPVTATTLFDLASITKTFSAHTALSLVDAGQAELDAPIGEILPSYHSGRRAAVTLRHLLAHTSGLPAEWLGWRAPLLASLSGSPEATRLTESPLLERRRQLLDDLLSTALGSEPGEEFVYSCAGYNTAMLYLEHATGRPWPELVREHTLEPLGLTTLTVRPARQAAVATEYEPVYRRGVVRGDAHDEAAWSLGGHAANAGLFGTGRDLLSFGEAILWGGDRVRGDWMWGGLGLRIGDREWGAATPRARTHIGFTGTLLHLDRESGTTIVLLTNRVHPSRESDIVDLRQAVVAAVLAGGHTPIDRGSDHPRSTGAVDSD